MTDNEIIKALECCGKDEWYCDNNCLFFKNCSKTLMAKSSLNLIKRQNAEIERLQKKANTPFAEVTFDENKLKEIADECVKNIEININLVRSEAIKEFAERLKEHRYGELHNRISFSVEYLNDLVKEMTEIATNQRKENEGK